MHRRRVGAVARQPGFLRREAQHRGEPDHDAAEQLVPAPSGRPCGSGGDRLAIERVLADIQIEGRRSTVMKVIELREDALVVEIRIGLAHERIELGQGGAASAVPAPACPSWRRGRSWKCARLPSIPRMVLRSLAVGLDIGLQDFRRRCADRPHSPTEQTHIRRMSAPYCLITSCGATTLPSDFDILRPSSASTKPCVSTTSKGAGRGCRSFPAATTGTSRDAGRSLRDTSPCPRRRRSCGGCRRAAGKCFAVFQHEGVGRAGIEPDVENVVDLLPAFVARAAPRKRAAAPFAIPGIRAFRPKASAMRSFTASS